MGRGFNNDILTLGVLLIGGYLIYTKTDWFQQGLAALKDIFADVRGGLNKSGGAGRRPTGGGGGGGGGGVADQATLEDLAPHDVDPEQSLAGRVPDRALGQGEGLGRRRGHAARPPRRATRSRMASTRLSSADSGVR